MSLLITNAEVEGRTVSVLLEEGRISAVGPRLPVPANADHVPANGGALISGLHDHHIHLRSAAAALRSVLAGPPEVTDVEGLRRSLRLRAARSHPRDWVRAVGYHESVAGLLDRHGLDAMVSDRPVRMQHRSGALWMLNSAAVDAVGIENERHPGIERDGNGRATGRLWRADRLLQGQSSIDDQDLAEVSAEAASYGVTGFTDATPALSDADLADLVAARTSGAISQRLHLMAPIGARLATEAGVTLGPVKIILDDDALPSMDELVAMIAHAQRAARQVAIHCVTRVQSVLAMAALESSGAEGGHRIEHASVFPTDLDAAALACGVTIVTQPHFILERGDDYLTNVAATDVDLLYRANTLRHAGVPLAAGTDAPFGSLSPWEAIGAATHRRARSGRLLGAAERMSPTNALDLFLGFREHPGRLRRVAEGEMADLCLLSMPLAEVLRNPTAGAVRATIVDGRVTHGG